MTRRSEDVGRIETGVRNLDEILMGGIPKGSVLVIAGPPGGGKTILAQQICFHSASAEQRVLYFSTLSEPTAKTLRYLEKFNFFDPAKLDAGGVQFLDLGEMLRSQGLETTAAYIMERVKEVRPAIVVIDSFRVFDDLAKSAAESRAFSYQLSVNLMAWEVTTFLLGEYSKQDVTTNPLFSIVDGLILITQSERSGEQQRFIQVIKLRGTAHSRDEHSFVINDAGADVFAPRVTLQREDRGPSTRRCKTDVSKLDDLLGDGIPLGSSLLIAGVAGTGKTVLLLEFLYRGALKGEKGIMFSFEETKERLLASAAGLGWDLKREIARGMIEIIFIAQPNIMIEQHLLMMREKVESMNVARVAIDSISVFMHKLKDPQIAREKVFQLASIIQNSQAVGFFATDIPYGSQLLSRFGVEETVVDGVVLLTSTEEGVDRQRYIEIYKLRNTAHLKGRHNMIVGAGGITIFPRYSVDEDLGKPTARKTRRVSSGVPGLDTLLGGGLIDQSLTLVSGSAGIGKTTLALQFIAEGARHNEPGLYVALEEGPTTLQKTAEDLGVSIRQAADSGLVEIMYLTGEHLRASHFLTLLDDKIAAQKTRRLVLDSVSHLSWDGGVPAELRQLLYAMAVRFKARGVTSMLTLEAETMYAGDTVTERGYSPIADNILLLRYARDGGELASTICVVKTRGSAHDRGTHRFSISKGGVQIVEPVTSVKLTKATVKKPAPARRRA